MTPFNAHPLAKLLRERIVILDGAMGTNIQTYRLDEAAYRGERFASHHVDLKGNNDLLCLTRPQVVEEVHEAFLDAGADIIETNTFNATTLSQADYQLEPIAYELNVAAAGCARRAAQRADQQTKEHRRADRTCHKRADKKREFVLNLVRRHRDHRQHKRHRKEDVTGREEPCRRQHDSEADPASRRRGVALLPRRTMNGKNRFVGVHPPKLRSLGAIQRTGDDDGVVRLARAIHLPDDEAVCAPATLLRTLSLRLSLRVSFPRRLCVPFRLPATGSFLPFPGNIA